jgi:hypothetical protein
MVTVTQLAKKIPAFMDPVGSVYSEYRLNLDPIQRHLNSVYIFASYLFKIYFNIILKTIPSSNSIIEIFRSKFCINVLQRSQIINKNTKTMWFESVQFNSIQCNSFVYLRADWTA